VQNLIAAYLGEAKRPCDMVPATDVSGSMAGDSLPELQSALRSPADTSTPTKNFSAFQGGESLLWLPSADSVTERTRYDFAPERRETALGEFRADVEALSARGGTAIYETLERAFTDAEILAGRSPDHHASVTLFTDGKNNGPGGLGSSSAWYREQDSDVPLLVVSFGDAVVYAAGLLLVPSRRPAPGADDLTAVRRSAVELERFCARNSLGLGPELLDLWSVPCAWWARSWCPGGSWRPHRRTGTAS